MTQNMPDVAQNIVSIQSPQLNTSQRHFDVILSGNLSEPISSQPDLPFSQSQHGTSPNDFMHSPSTFDALYNATEPSLADFSPNLANTQPPQLNDRQLPSGEILNSSSSQPISSLHCSPTNSMPILTPYTQDSPFNVSNTRAPTHI